MAEKETKKMIIILNGDMRTYDQNKKADENTQTEIIFKPFSLKRKR